MKLFPRPSRAKHPFMNYNIESSAKACFFKQVVISVLGRFADQNPPSYLCG
jgi:hypothetical protein